MTTKIIYNADTEYPRTVILNHGGSETQVIYDSEGTLTDWSAKSDEKSFDEILNDLYELNKE